MKEIRIKLPASLNDEKKKIEEELQNIVLVEEKRRIISRLLDKLMEGAGKAKI